MDRVSHEAAEVSADPEKRDAIAGLAQLVKRPEFARVAKRVMFVVCLAFTMHMLGLLLAEQLTAGQEGIDERTLAVAGIVAAVVVAAKSK